MTLQPSPYEIIRAIQDQQRATDRLVVMLIGMLDKSAPDPVLTSAAAIQPVSLPARPVPPTKRDRRLVGEAARPAVIVAVGGDEVRTTERRARLLNVLRDAPMTLAELVSAAIAPTVAGVKAQIIDLNADLDQAGCPLRIVATAGGQRLGAKGGRNPSTYRLVDPNASPELSTAAQSEAAAGSIPEKAASDSAVGEGEAEASAQDAEFVTSAGAGEDRVSRPAPAPAADDAPSLSEASSAPPPGAAQASPPTEAECPPATPSAGYVPGREKALDMWAKTSMSVAEIATAAKMQPISVRRAIDAARGNGDPRAVAKEARPKPEAAPAAAAAPLQLPIEPGDLIAVDIKQRRIQTTRGEYEVGGANLARALEKLSGGDLFGLDVIAKVAGWPSPDVARTALGFERKRLADHGVDLFMDKFNVRLREAS